MFSNNSSYTCLLNSISFVINEKQSQILSSINCNIAHQIKRLKIHLHICSLKNGLADIEDLNISTSFLRCIDHLLGVDLWKEKNPSGTHAYNTYKHRHKHMNIDQYSTTAWNEATPIFSFSNYLEYDINKSRAKGLAFIVPKKSKAGFCNTWHKLRFT